ncbi:MAG: B12-binding domain-containing radical SAM protein [Dehalococcoidia bacterium]|nr:B12-binding domain-containing radical SAM protein [Dehalococcoidia bacterium]
MKILLVYPQYPDTFWSFRHALRVISKKAAFPPLGLLTVASMLPPEWEKKLVDMNAASLTDDAIRWADYVFISAMVVQRQSVKDVIARCKKLGAKTVAGGPLFTSEPEKFDDVDYLVLDEGEVTLPLFLQDLEQGCAKRVYTSTERPDITKTPIPMWSLLDMKKYTTMSIQYSRGCPYNCEFCDIIILNGNRPRTKARDQVLAELDALYRRGWRQGVFVVDDNFIGNKRKLKAEILPSIEEWQQARKYPFGLFTEASINLADDEALMNAMVAAGFDTVFIGIETPNEESLAECNKFQNRERDLVESVKVIQNHGFQVQGGFILGFDSDPVSIFKSQINFIQRSGIVTAMVGLLNAPRGTRLYQRLHKEDRLLGEFTGDNTDCSMNFIPKMDRETLINGYHQIMTTIYSSKDFYTRVKTFLKEYRPHKKKKTISELKPWHLWAFARLMWYLGVRDRERKHYWRFFFSTLLKRPRTFPMSMSFAVYGFHFRTVARKSLPVANRR